MKRRILLSSIMMIVICITMISGATFALFTSESKTSITIQSGNVEVLSSIDDVKLYSMEKLQSEKFENGGKVKIEGNEVLLNLLTPGDRVTFKVVGNNKSNVSIQYRVKVEVLDGYKLASGLVFTIDDNEYLSLSRYQTAWKLIPANMNLDDLSISIELPAEAGNEYQNLETKVCISVEAVQGNAKPEGIEKVEYFDIWDGTAETSWYSEEKTEFVLDSAEQIAGLSDLVDEGKTFEGKTIKLEADMNLETYDENGNLVCFDPIGSYRNDQSFMGTFDGQGHTISNMSQNTWALDNGYYYGDLGLGFFGKVENATIKNVNMDKASISGESAICGAVAGTAYGDCVFENVTVSNSNVADYQYYAGGIVGWASGNHQYINCNIEASTTIAAQWGDFDNAVGGVIGGAGGNAQILIKDCTVECRIDAYNDVTSANQWYAYRRTGMLIGNTGKTEVIDGTTYAAAPQLTCENVTVIYGEWANYTYCEFAGKSWPYVRVQAGVSNSAYSNPRYGHPIDAAGNEVVDDNHVHNTGEDHHILCVFDQLYGGGTGVYGTSSHEGVKVIYNNK